MFVRRSATRTWFSCWVLHLLPPPLHLPSPVPGPLSPNGHRSVGNRSPNGCCWLSMYCERFAMVGDRSFIFRQLWADQLLQLADQKVLGECRQPLRTHPRPVGDLSPTIDNRLKTRKIFFRQVWSENGIRCSSEYLQPTITLVQPFAEH